MDDAAQQQGRGKQEDVVEDAQARRAHDPGHQGEDAEGRHLHHQAGDVENDVHPGIEQLAHRIGLLADRQDGRAHQEGEEDHRQDVAAGQGLDGVQRHDADQLLADRRGRADRLGRDAFEGDALARTEQDAHDHADADRDGGGQQIEEDGLGADGPQAPRIAHARHAGDDGDEDQGHDDHADQPHEQVADPLDGVRLLAQQQAGYDAKDQGQQNPLPQDDIEPPALKQGAFGGRLDSGARRRRIGHATLLILGPHYGGGSAQVREVIGLRQSLSPDCLRKTRHTRRASGVRGPMASHRSRRPRSRRRIPPGAQVTGGLWTDGPIGITKIDERNTGAKITP